MKELRNERMEVREKGRRGAGEEQWLEKGVGEGMRKGSLRCLQTSSPSGLFNQMASQLADGADLAPLSLVAPLPGRWTSEEARQRVPIEGRLLEQLCLLLAHCWTRVASSRAEGGRTWWHRLPHPLFAFSPKPSCHCLLSSLFLCFPCTPFPRPMIFCP